MVPGVRNLSTGGKLLPREVYCLYFLLTYLRDGVKIDPDKNSYEFNKITVRIHSKYCYN